MKIVLLDEAQRRFEIEERWWWEHRDAKELFLDEFRDTLRQTFTTATAVSSRFIRSGEHAENADPPCKGPRHCRSGRVIGSEKLNLSIAESDAAHVAIEMATLEKNLKLCARNGL